MKKLILFMLLGAVIVVLCGCASAGWAKRNYDDKVNAVMGKTENDLLRLWGPPKESYVSSDGQYRYLTYIWLYEGIENPGTSGGYLKNPDICKTVFTLQNNKVVHVTSQGECFIY